MTAVAVASAGGHGTEAVAEVRLCRWVRRTDVTPAARV